MMTIDGTEPFEEKETFQAGIAKVILLCAASVFSALTVLTHLAQIFKIQFNVYAAIGSVIAVVTAAAVLYVEIPKIRNNILPIENRITFLLLACCLFSVVLCLFSFRTSTDDCFYLPNAVYYMQHPVAPMGFVIHFLESGGEPFVSYHRCSIPFEYIQGIVAYISRQNLLTVYFILMPAFVGFAIPLAWYYLISRFASKPVAVIYGTLLICLCLSLMGGVLRSYGNFAFNRIYQGKTVALAMGIPLFAALTIDFFRFPKVRIWLYLFAVSTAMVGCTVASAMLVPLFAVLLAAASSVSYVSGWKTRITRSFLYLCSLAYPVVYAVSILLLSLEQVGSASSLNMNWPTTFLGHLKFVMYDPAVVIFMVIGTIGSGVFLKNQNRRFLIAWFALAIVLYLNPVVAPFLIKHVTSPNVYWRLFYLLPFPLVIGLAGAALISLLERRTVLLRTVIPWGLVALLLAAHLPAKSTSVFRASTFIFEDRYPRPPTRLRMPGYKIENLKVTRQVLNSCPENGTMLAPQSISTTAAILSGGITHICYRVDGIRMWFEAEGRMEEVDARTNASHYLAGADSDAGMRSVTWLLEQYPHINMVVANRKAVKARNGELGRYLRSVGFSIAGEAGHLKIFARRQSG